MQEALSLFDPLGHEVDTLEEGDLLHAIHSLEVIVLDIHEVALELVESNVVVHDFNEGQVARVNGAL